MFSIALDAWTSSNNYAFLAIVLHWISSEGILGEILFELFEIKVEIKVYVSFCF